MWVNVPKVEPAIAVAEAVRQPAPALLSTSLLPQLLAFPPGRGRFRAPNIGFILKLAEARRYRLAQEKFGAFPWYPGPALPDDEMVGRGYSLAGAGMLLDQLSADEALELLLLHCLRHTRPKKEIDEERPPRPCDMTAEEKAREASLLRRVRRYGWVPPLDVDVEKGCSERALGREYAHRIFDAAPGIGFGDLSVHVTNDRGGYHLHPDASEMEPHPELLRMHLPAVGTLARVTNIPTAKGPTVHLDISLYRHFSDACGRMWRLPGSTKPDGQKKTRAPGFPTGTRRAEARILSPAAPRPAARPRAPAALGRASPAAPGASTPVERAYVSAHPKLLAVWTDRDDGSRRDARLVAALAREGAPRELAERLFDALPDGKGSTRRAGDEDYRARTFDFGSRVRRDPKSRALWSTPSPCPACGRSGAGCMEDPDGWVWCRANGGALHARGARAQGAALVAPRGPSGISGPVPFSVDDVVALGPEGGVRDDPAYEHHRRLATCGRAWHLVRCACPDHTPEEPTLSSRPLLCGDARLCPRCAAQRSRRYREVRRRRIPAFFGGVATKLRAVVLYPTGVGPGPEALEVALARMLGPGGWAGEVAELRCGAQGVAFLAARAAGEEPGRPYAPALVLVEQDAEPDAPLAHLAAARGLAREVVARGSWLDLEVPVECLREALARVPRSAAEQRAAVRALAGRRTVRVYGGRLSLESPQAEALAGVVTEHPALDCPRCGEAACDEHLRHDVRWPDGTESRVGAGRRPPRNITLAHGAFVDLVVDKSRTRRNL